MKVTHHSPDHISLTSSQVASKQTIMANIALWRRNRRRRQIVEASHDKAAAGFNTIGRAMEGGSR